MGRTACTEPQCLYKGALYLITFYQMSELLHIYKGQVTKLCVVILRCVLFSRHYHLGLLIYK